MATSNDLKNGLVLNIEGQLWTVVEFQHVKPGKGAAFVRSKLKNFITGNTVEKTWRAGESVSMASVEKKETQFTDSEGDVVRSPTPPPLPRGCSPLLPLPTCWPARAPAPSPPPPHPLALLSCPSSMCSWT